MPGDPYEVRLTRQAEKDLKALRSGTARATQALLTLEQDPERGHTLAGSLLGARSLEFSMAGGAYRAAYVVMEDQKRCVVFLVGPHEGFYKKAERRYEALKKRESALDEREKSAEAETPEPDVNVSEEAREDVGGE